MTAAQNTSTTEGWALRAQGLAYAYPNAAPTFSDITLAVRPREIVCLLGGSGCGKSTLLRVLAGLQTPSERQRVSFSARRCIAPQSAQRALVFQQASLLPWLDVTANAGFGLDFSRASPKIDATTRNKRIACGTPSPPSAWPAASTRYPAQLSGGMAQRVALGPSAGAPAGAVVCRRTVFRARRHYTRTEMQALLVDVVHRWHTAVLLVTHDIDEAMLVADRIRADGWKAGPHRAANGTVDIARIRACRPFRRSSAQLRLDILAALRNLRLTND
jgi:NitT/TauT family transport system ATP-binding protein